MILVLLVPLLVPFLVPPLARRAVGRLAPGVALWVVTGSALVLAGASVAALGSLVLTGLLQLPFFAALGDFVRPLHVPAGLPALPVGALAMGALTISAWALARSALRQVRSLRTARAQADRRPATGDLCVIDSPYPDAYALPGRPHRIVVTTGMLRSLGPDEHRALFAHERAHLRGGHHHFLVAAELAAHCHPGLRPLRSCVRFAVERAADEAAATDIGDRRLLARAIARAALAAHDTQPPRPPLAPAATSGPVPQRVAALLASSGRTSRVGLSVALLLTACVSLSAGAAAAGLDVCHHEIEVAQGEQAR
ncbi:M56 family metallopeptidase [Streptomyces sp. MS06]|uniref:M56 family metallopeptidase n=1 Tax=Streptomyces sp. MS06 TaxID=3385974 RepID=UPI00399F6DB7